jgi:putative transcriptional regulator
MIRCRLSAVLGAKRITMAELHRRTNISVSALSLIYNEKVERVHYATLDKLCQALNVQPGDLLVWEPDESQPKT